MPTFFNACLLLLNGVTPTTWTIGVAIPYHTGNIGGEALLWIGSKFHAGQGGKAHQISFVCTEYLQCEKCASAKGKYS